MLFLLTACGDRKGVRTNLKGRMRRVLLLAAVTFIFGMLLGCAQETPAANVRTDHDAVSDATMDALTAWWKEALPDPPPPIKAGTVTPAHTIALKTGRVLAIPKHVQTKQEADEQAEDARWVDHERAIVQGFNVKGPPVTVMTNLTGGPADIRDAKEICGNLGGFVWANENRHFGLQNIKVTGAHGVLLASRIGLSGKVQ